MVRARVREDARRREGRVVAVAVRRVPVGGQVRRERGRRAREDGVGDDAVREDVRVVEALEGVLGEDRVLGRGVGDADHRERVAHRAAAVVHPVDGEERARLVEGGADHDRDLGPRLAGDAGAHVLGRGAVAGDGREDERGGLDVGLDRGGVHLAQAGDVSAGELLEDLVVAVEAGAEEQALLGLHDGRGEGQRGRRVREELLHGLAAGGLAKDGDALRVAAEGRDVVLDPLQGEALVEVASVLGALGDLRGVGEAEDVGAVVDGDDDNVLGDGEGAAVVDGQAGGAELEVAREDPEHDGLLGGRGRGGRREDVEVEAVLALGRQGPGRVTEDGLLEGLGVAAVGELLDAGGLEGRRGERGGPFCRGLGRGEPLRRRLGEGNSEICVCAGG